MQSGTNWLEDFKVHATESFPCECVGYVKDDQYVRLENTHPQPESNFRISLATLITVNPEIVLHSHPHHGQPNSSWPSLSDLKCFYSKPEWKWGIISTDGEEYGQFVLFDDKNPTNLIGREYIWGIQDCYSLIRDWYKIEMGITLKNYPRDYNSHQHGNANYYESNFADAGFYEVPINDIKIGDVLLLSINSHSVNHAAIVSGNDEIMHHWLNRLSAKDSLSKWLRATSKVVRYGTKST